MKSSGILMLILLLIPAHSMIDAREWTDQSGRFSVEADLVDVKDGMAMLKKADGTVVSVPIERLSDADRAYLRTLAPKPAREPKERPSVTVGQPTVVAERLVVNDDLSKLNTLKNGYFVHLRCTVTTRQRNLTIGSRKGKTANSDVVEFKDFSLLYQTDRKAPAVAIGQTVMGPVTLYLSPDEFGNIVNINDQKEYTWEIDVVFVLPRGTREAQFTFKAQEPVAIEIPASLE